MTEILVNGRSGEKVIPLPDDRPLVIGRKGRLRIDDRQISRQHARVVRRDNAWYVEDLGSTNGTYINQVRVTRTERVQPGDTIRIGSTSLVVRQSPPPPPPTASLPQAIAPATSIAPRAQRAIEIPAHGSTAQRSLAIASEQPGNGAGDVASRRWGPIVLVGMTLTLLVSILFSAISYARTMSALRTLEAAAQRRADERSLELITALRSDLRKPPAGLADLAASLERAAVRVNEASRGSEDRAGEQIARLQRSTSDELAEIRRTLDGLSKKLETPLPLPPPPAQARAETDVAVATPLVGVEGPAVVKLTVEPDAGIGTTVAPRHDAAPDIVFVIDASRGLAGALQQALAQVRIAKAELAPNQVSRILVARRTDVAEIGDDWLAPASLDDLPAAHVEDTDARTGAPVTRAVTAALKLNPRTLHVLTDHPGDGPSRLRDLFRSGAAGATSVNVTHFYTRQYREDLKALARDHGGIYAFIGQG